MGWVAGWLVVWVAGGWAGWWLAGLGWWLAGWLLVAKVGKSVSTSMGTTIQIILIKSL